MRKFKLRRLILVAGLAALVALVLASVAAAASPGAATDTPDLTDDLGSWAALVGIALPGLTALLQKVTFPSWVNALIFAAACAVASVVYGFIKFGNDFTWAHWQGTLLAIVVWGIGTYHTFYKANTSRLGGNDVSLATKLRALPPVK